MIPKIIHYCWFGGKEKSKLAKKCIESWKKYCPDYQIIEWNESSFDTSLIRYTAFTYQRKMYAYLSDYVRLWAVYNYGGIYFDTDVELIANPDSLLKYSAFFGFENDTFVNTGIGFGAEKENQSVRIMLSKYEERTVEYLNNEIKEHHCLTGSPKMNTYALLELGLKQTGEQQRLSDGIVIFSKDVFCPFDDETGVLNLSKKTISIHWFSKSAQGKFVYYKSKISRWVHRILKESR